MLNLCTNYKTFITGKMAQKIPSLYIYYKLQYYFFFST